MAHNILFQEHGCTFAELTGCYYYTFCLLVCELLHCYTHDDDGSWPMGYMGRQGHWAVDRLEDSTNAFH